MRVLKLQLWYAEHFYCASLEGVLMDVLVFGVLWVVGSVLVGVTCIYLLKFSDRFALWLLSPKKGVKKDAKGYHD